MKFEKLNNDKLKITLNTADLKANDIDFHSFMANSDETQSLFLEMLDKAEKDYDFATDNYHLKVETLALDNGNFILTITRSRNSISSVSIPEKKRFKVSRKVPSLTSASLIYKFNTFEDVCGFANFLSKSSLHDVDAVSKTSMLYCYNSCYYLIFNNINVKYPHLKSLYSAITEFATYVDYSDTLAAKLHESAALIIKNHVIQVCSKYFL